MEISIKGILKTIKRVGRVYAILEMERNMMGNGLRIILMVKVNTRGQTAIFTKETSSWDSNPATVNFSTLMAPITKATG